MAGGGNQADFFKISLNYADNAPTRLSIELDEQTAQAWKDGILQFTCRDERGRSITLCEVAPGELNTKKAISDSEIYIGVMLKKPEESVDYSFKVSNAVSPLSGSIESVS